MNYASLNTARSDRRLNIKSKFNYITGLHNVGFALGADFAGSSGG